MVENFLLVTRKADITFLTIFSPCIRIFHVPPTKRGLKLYDILNRFFLLGDSAVNKQKYEFEDEPIRGYPELRWQGKRPFRSTQFYPAQLKETYGKPVDGWLNRIYWGDNHQVMSHLMKEFRGKVQLIYIDPPFNSKAEYKKKVILKGKHHSVFEEKQYTDIWTNDDYLQFMYERLILCRELLSDQGSIYIHLGPNISHYVKTIVDGVFGPSNFLNELIWKRAFGHSDSGKFGAIHDIILFYGKNKQRIWNKLFQKPDKEYINRFFDSYDKERNERYQRLSLSAGGLTGGGYDYEYKGVRTNWRCPLSTLKKHDKEKRLHWPKNGGVPRLKKYESEYKGMPIQDLWLDISKIHNQSPELYGYPTQKPEALLERIIMASSNPSDLVLDCFMGSGTTQAVAMKLGRRFIGADINLGAIQITTKRLLSVAANLKQQNAQVQIDTDSDDDLIHYTGFSVYNVEILRDEANLEFKRDSEAKVIVSNGKLVIEQFYPMNLLQKLSLFEENVEDWRELTESVMVDWNYDGDVLRPEITDIPGKNKLVKGEYKIPKKYSRIRVKITDMLSEHWEGDVSMAMRGQ